MVFNATVNNISVPSWQSVFLVEETGVPRENHRLIVSHWQNLSHQFYRVHLAMTGSCKSNYHRITTTTVPMSYIIHSKPDSDYETDVDRVLKLSRAYIIYQVGPIVH